MVDPKSKRPSLLERGWNSAKEETADLLELASTLPEHAMAPLRWVLENYGPEGLKMAIKSLKKLEKGYGPEGYKGQIPTISKKMGITKDYPKAETYEEKVAENIGRGASSIATALPLTGLRAIKTLPGALGTIGSILPQALLSPKIEETLPNSPTSQFLANLGLGIGGGMAGTKIGKLATSSREMLPRATSAQLAPIESELSDKLITKSLDQARSDTKYARKLNQIVKNQHKKVIDDLVSPGSETLKGSEIVDSINNSFERIKTERRKLWDEAAKPVFAANRKIKPDLSDTMYAIHEAIQNAPEGTKLKPALQNIAHLILMNENDLVKLNSVKSHTQGLAGFPGRTELHLNSADQSIVGKIAHQLRNDIEKAFPEMKNINKKYGDISEYLNELQEGIIGKSVKSARTKPSDVIQKIFEVDPELSKEFQKIIPKKVYDAAAKTYLADVVQKNLGKPGWNQKNNANQMYALRSHLESNIEKLSESLPKQYQSKVNKAIEDIKISERGVPRDDYLNKIDRTVTTGNEAKGIGRIDLTHLMAPAIGGLIGGGAGILHGGLEGGIEGLGAGIGSIYGYKGLSKKLNRNRLLTGETPLEYLGAKASKGIAPAIMAGKVTSKTEEPQPEESLKPKKEPRVPDVPNENKYAWIDKSFEELKKPKDISEKPESDKYAWIDKSFEELKKPKRKEPYIEVTKGVIEDDEE